MTTEPPTAWSRGALLLLLAALLVAGLVPVLATDAPQDDAYITYRYAMNFANGDGFVFNVGEKPVEGYTNFLWTLIIGLGMRAGVEPEGFAPGLGLAATGGVALLTALLARARGARGWLAALAALVYAVRPGLTVHAMSGLETPLFALLFLGGLLPRMRAKRRPRDELVSGLCLALAALTRPEGMLRVGLRELADAIAALHARGVVGNRHPRGRRPRRAAQRETEFEEVELLEHQALVVGGAVRLEGLGIRVFRGVV